MARYLALDWDRAELRMVVARTGADGIQVDSVTTAPLDLGAQESNLDGLEEQLKKGLASAKLPRCPALTAIGRAQVELRMLKLPPAPDEELPDMVRFQAMREFSSLSENQPLDFVPLGEAGSTPGEVMAVSMPVGLKKHVESALASVGSEPQRAALRPCSAASLAMRRCPRARQGTTLVIAQLADSAELAIARNGTVVFTRSFRLPRDWHPGETGEPLVGEVRRSIAAGQNQLGGDRVDHIVFFGTPEEHSVLCDRLKERIELDVELINPFAGIKVAGATPDQPERFAALIGMLHDEATNERPAIDFINPRKKPAPKSNRRLHVLIAATAATILLAFGSIIYWQFHRLDVQIADYKQKNLANENEIKQLSSDVELAAALDTWKSADRDFLTILYRISAVDKVTAEDFRIESLNCDSVENRLGTAAISGVAKTTDVKTVLQDALVDEDHDVVSGMTTISRVKDARYPRVFGTTVRLKRSIPIVSSKPKQIAASDASANESSPPTDNAKVEPDKKNET